VAGAQAEKEKASKIENIIDSAFFKIFSPLI
jgi:hypothetical protein